jgi:hypothetical protein
MASHFRTLHKVLGLTACIVFLAISHASTIDAASCADWPGISHYRDSCGIQNGTVLVDDCNSGTGQGRLLCDCATAGSPWACVDAMSGACQGSDGETVVVSLDVNCFWPSYCGYYQGWPEPPPQC